MGLTLFWIPRLFSLSPVRLEKPLVKFWKARRGQAHGPAGPRGPGKARPSIQTTMIWATTCGQTYFKVRPKGKDGAVNTHGPQGIGQERPLGCPLHSWTSMVQDPRMYPQVLIAQPPRPVSVPLGPGPVPSARNVQSPGRPALAAQTIRPGGQSALPCFPDTSCVLICQDEAWVFWFLW